MGIKRLAGLSVALGKAKLKLKNEGTYLGVLWYLLSPILTFLLLLFIFGQKLGSDIPHYPLYLLMGIVILNFFQQVTFSSLRSIKDNENLIKSISLPKETLITSNVLNESINHFFEILVFVVIMLIMNLSVLNAFFYLIILIVFIIFIYGCCLILSSLYLFFNDLENIWDFVSRLLFFGSPIFYSVEPGTILYKVNQFNPLYHFMTISRDILIYKNFPGIWNINGALISTFLVLIIGTVVFNKYKKKFADYI